MLDLELNIPTFYMDLCHIIKTIGIFSFSTTKYIGHTYEWLKEENTRKALWEFSARRFSVFFCVFIVFSLFKTSNYRPLSNLFLLGNTTTPYYLLNIQYLPSKEVVS